MIDFKTMLKNNLSLNGVTNKFPADHFDHPGGPDWRGFMFEFELVNGSVHILMAIGDTTDSEWRCRSLDDAATVRFVPERVLLEIYAVQLQGYIEDTGGVL